MKARARQLFSFLTLCFLSHLNGEPAENKTYSLKFSDVDGHELSTAGGPTTVLVFVAPGNLAKGQTVGDRIPDFCLGNPNYRMITFVETKNHSAPIRALFKSTARRRLDAAAKKLQLRYDAKKISRNARADVFAVIDFGGKIAGNFASPSSTSDFRVVILGPDGSLRQRWTDLPSADQLTAALK